jgi:hypothetical protein
VWTRWRNWQPFYTPKRSKELTEIIHLPFDMLTALSETEGLRYPHPRPVKFSLRETAKPI